MVWLRSNYGGTSHVRIKVVVQLIGFGRNDKITPLANITQRSLGVRCNTSILRSPFCVAHKYIHRSVAKGNLINKNHLSRGSKSDWTIIPYPNPVSSPPSLVTIFILQSHPVAKTAMIQNLTQHNNMNISIT